MMRLAEVVVGVFCGFAITAFGAFLASGIALFIFSFFEGPFLQFVK